MIEPKILILFLPLLLLAEAQNARFMSRMPIRRPAPQSKDWVETTDKVTNIETASQKKVTSKPLQLDKTNSRLTTIYPEDSQIKPDISPLVNEQMRSSPPFWQRTVSRLKRIIETSSVEPQSRLRFPSYTSSDVPSSGLQAFYNTEPLATDSADAQFSLDIINSETNLNVNQPAVHTINRNEHIAKTTDSPVTIMNYPETTVKASKAQATEIVATMNKNEDVKLKNDQIANLFINKPDIPLSETFDNAINLPLQVIPSWYSLFTRRTDNDPVGVNMNGPAVLPSQPWYSLSNIKPNNPPFTSLSTFGPNVNLPPVVTYQPWYPPHTTEVNNRQVTSVSTIRPNVNGPPAVSNQPWYSPFAITEKTESHNNHIKTLPTRQVYSETTTVPIKRPVTIPTKPRRVVTKGSSRNQVRGHKCQEPNGYYSVLGQCDGYIECKKNVASHYSCQDGLHFNPKVQWPEFPCSYPTEVTCQSEDLVQDPLPTSDCPHQYGFFPTTTGNCGKYIMCQKGYAKVMSCPPGLAFNFNITSCDWPANVAGCNPDIFKDFTCPASPIGDDERSADFIYKYRYEKSCKKYIACQQGHPRLLSCDNGLSFNEESESCIDSGLVFECV